MSSSPRISFADVRANRWTVIGDEVFDLRRFGPRHPGGGAVAQMQAMDATLPLVNAHGVQGEAGARLPRKLSLGAIDEDTLPASDRDLRAMWRSFQQRGLFRYRTRWLVTDVARGLGLFAAAVVAATLSTPVALVLFTVALLNVMWWVHDVCHDSVFADRARGKRWGELASMLFVGTPVLDYQHVVHRIHHGFTNVVGADQALETGPVVWDERMRARSVAGFIPFQALAWFLLVLPLTFPIFLVSAVVARARKRDHAKLALVALRWAAALALFRGHLALLVVPVLAAGYLLAFFSSLNHFHKPMTDRLDPSFGPSVMRVTQNLVHAGPLATWLTGGLNFHIEHHLFATMPRQSYRQIAPEVRAYCARHGLPYSTCTFGQAVAALWTKLRRPFADDIVDGIASVAQ